MKDALTFLGLLLLIFLALPLQEFLPALHALGGARLLLAPMIFCFGALSLPFPYMVLLALYTGLLGDLMNLPLVDGRPELALGTSMFFYLIAGSICQGLRNLFLKGYWGVFSIMSGVTTSALLLLQFLLISFRRFDQGGLDWNNAVAWRIFIPGFLALCIAPVFHLAAHYLGRTLFPPPVRERAF